MSGGLAALSDDKEAVILEVFESVSTALDEYHFPMKPSVMPLFLVRHHMVARGSSQELSGFARETKGAKELEWRSSMSF